MISQDNFILYCTKVKKLKMSTAKHYCESIRKISQVINDFGIYDFDSLYDIDSYSRLREIESLLKSNPAFIELDEKGHRMYTAGLHRYMNFAEGKNLKEEDSLSLLDCPCPVKAKNLINERYVSNRDRIIVHQVMEAENYTCDINQSHKTFISAKTSNQYMEGHHLIPLKSQEFISNSLDVYANIVVLCPNCHRFLHYGTVEDKKPILLNLFSHRKDRLKDSGINMEKNEFIDLLKLDSNKKYYSLSL